MNNSKNIKGARSRILTGVSSVALILSSTLAFAAEDASINTDVELEEISITGSRIKASGFETPTPVTMIGEEDMKVRGTTNVADIINELPSFTQSRTPTSTILNSRASGINALDLRGLGTNRNLVLVNGRRHAPTDEFGNVDLNIIPTLAIKRVEVVTGGASAAYGSDAISGVVNLIYDTTLEGMKVETQYGISGQGDGESTRFSIAYGSTFADDRGHVFVAADYVENKGIPLASARDWSARHPGFIGNPADTGPNDGIAAFHVRDDVKMYWGNANGVTLDGGPLGNLEFLPDGTVGPRELGLTAGLVMEGGNGAYVNDFAALLTPTKRQNILVAFDYDINDDVNFYFEGSAAKSSSFAALLSSFTFGYTVNSGNPYLPASVQTTMDAEGIDSFGLYRINEDFGAISSDSRTQSIRFVTGLKGDIGDKWSWDVFYQYGRTDFSNRQVNNVVPGNLKNAMDAVIDPGTGNIVCAAALSGIDPDCVPINMFGNGSPSSDAIDYVTGTSISDTEMRQDVISASFSGELAEGWAGPISMAFGAEYRKESLTRIVDDLSENKKFLVVNAQSLEGSYEAKEAFGEIMVPLLDPENSGQSLNFNGAVRFTDYSSSGSVFTWKTGLTYEPVSSVRVRGSISRDIRAPSIGETFLKNHLLFGSVVNPFTGNNDSISIFNTGNTSLKEERSITKTIGVVYSPESIENLRVSVDWYDISISGAINSISSQAIVDRCGAGDAALCDQITFAADNTILDVTNSFLNLGSFRIKGVDFAVRYGFDLDDQSDLGLSVLGSYVSSKVIDADGTNPVDYAGELGESSGFGMAKWKVRTNLDYTRGAFSFHTQARYIGPGRFDVTMDTETLSTEDNAVKSEIYVDISARYRFALTNDQEIEVFGGINNVLDNDPQALPINFFASTATYAGQYDVIGRYFFLGARAEF